MYNYSRVDVAAIRALVMPFTKPVLFDRKHHLCLNSFIDETRTLKPTSLSIFHLIVIGKGD